MRSLNVIELRGNHLCSLPAEILRMNHLRTVGVSENPLLKEFHDTNTLSPPSLYEISARWFVRHRISFNPKLIPEPVNHFLQTAKVCSFCQRPYFHHFSSRGKFEIRGDDVIPFVYNLCSPHWDSEEGRLRSLFQPIPSTAPLPLDIFLFPETSPAHDDSACFISSSFQSPVENSVKKPVKKPVKNSVKSPLKTKLPSLSSPSLSFSSFATLEDFEAETKPTFYQDSPLNSLHHPNDFMLCATFQPEHTPQKVSKWTGLRSFFSSFISLKKNTRSRRRGGAEQGIDF
eukprot:Sdes_comp18097_c0_seq2m7529